MLLSFLNSSYFSENSKKLFIAIKTFVTMAIVLPVSLGQSATSTRTTQTYVSVGVLLLPFKYPVLRKNCNTTVMVGTRFFQTMFFLKKIYNFFHIKHCGVNIVLIWRFSGPYFSGISNKYGDLLIRARTTPISDTFYAVESKSKYVPCRCFTFQYFSFFIFFLMLPFCHLLCQGILLFLISLRLVIEVFLDFKGNVLL